jgi:tRNA(fMet)-specific endonuclease VapC
MLDTDTCIHVRARRSRSVAERFAALRPGEAVISAVTYGELRLGAEKSPAREMALRVLATLISGLEIKDLNQKVAEEYAEIRASLERAGKIIGGNDLWIAAHARSAGLTLVTNNEREFRRVAGLSVENWASAT